MSLGTILIPSLAAQESNQTTEWHQEWLLCSFDHLFTPYDVAADFVVNVAFRTKPMAGVKLELEAETNSADESQPSPILLQTDSEGNATFYSVPPGKYWLVVKETTPSYSSEVTVTPDAEPSERIKLEWPLVESTASHFAGTLHNDAQQAFPGALVQLLELRTSRVLDSTRTDAAGVYKLRPQHNGVYVLRFSPPGKPERHQDIAVELDDGSLNDQLPTLALQLSDCGDGLVVEK